MPLASHPVRMLIAPALAAFSVALAARGIQAPGTTANPPADPAPPSAEPPVSATSKDDSSDAASARGLAKKWIADKGWVRGMNPDGSYVAIGTSSFNAVGGSNALARAQAFTRASLKAKNELAEFRSKSIETMVLSTMDNGMMPPDAERDSSKDLIEALAKGAMADVANHDSSTPAMVSERSASVIRSVARSEVAGSAVSNTFEFERGNGQGAFAVVLRFSPTSRQMARAALGRGEAPINPDLLDATTWAKKSSPSELARCYGARLMRDQATNEVVVVSFGQADVRGDSDLSEELALDTARLAADGAMRQFVGELVESEGTLIRATDMKEIEGSGLTAKDMEAFEKRFEARANSLDLQGITQIHDWTGQLPGKRPVIGVVMMWSVKESNAANLLGQEMDEIGASKGGSGRRDVSVGNGSGAPINPKGREYPPLEPGTKGPETPEP